jgi:hypothetical protein
MTDRIVQLMLAVILVVLVGGVWLEARELKAANTRAEAAEAVSVRLEHDLNAWEIAGQRCSEAIDQARQADPSRKAGQK